MSTAQENNEQQQTTQTSEPVKRQPTITILICFIFSIYPFPFTMVVGKFHTLPPQTYIGSKHLLV
jgi:hypothetical protein